MQDSMIKNPFVFAAVICLVCSAALSLCASSLRPIQTKNQKIYQHRNILLAVGIPGDPNAEFSNEDVEQVFAAQMEKITIDSEGVPVESVEVEGESDAAPDTNEIYLYKDETGEVQGYVLPLSGQGLWGPISGYLALEPDMNTVKGVTFFTKMETPGLGAEIANSWFEDQFKGKHIFDDQGNLVSIDVVKGEAEKIAADRIDHAVDGVSGATITSDGVTAMLENWLNIYEPYFRSVKNSEKEAA